MLKRIIISALLVSVWVSCAFAEGPYVFVADQDLPPYSMRTQEGPAGIDVELFQEMAKRLGLEYSLELLPWEVAVSKIESGEVAGGFSLFRTPEREDLMVFVDGAMHLSDYAIFVRSNKKFTFEGVSDLKGRRIGINAGVPLPVEFREAAEKGHFELVKLADTASCVREVLAGTVDGFVGQVDTTYYNLSRMGLSDTIMYLPGRVQTRVPAYLVLSRTGLSGHDLIMAEKMSQTLNAIIRDGTFNTIARKYLIRY